MRRVSVHALVLALVLPAAVRGDDAAKPEQAPPKTVAGVTLSPPAGWQEKPAGGMRKAQYAVPKVEGDAEDGELVIFHFGGGGGSVEDNITRWCGQFERPDGKPAREAAKVEKKTIAGLEVHLVELDGTYVAETRPGSGQRQRKEGWRLLAAIIVGPEGPIFVKLAGPTKTLEAAREKFQKYIESASKD